MPTLDSFFPPGAMRGDGRKFKFIDWGDGSWFEPLFKDTNGDWHGLDEDGQYIEVRYCVKNDNWQEWTPPKKTKKVTLYKPVMLDTTYEGSYVSLDWQHWHSKKEYWKGSGIVVGWITCEAEVEEGDSNG